MPYDERQGSPIPYDSENRTTYHAAEAPDVSRLDGTETKRQQMQRLFRQYQTGLKNGEWTDKEKMRSVDNIRMLNTIAGQLELTDYQQERARRILDSVSVPAFRSPDRDVALIGFSLCVLVYNDDTATESRYYPTKTENPERFEPMAESISCSDGQVISMIEKIRKRIENDENTDSERYDPGSVVDGDKEQLRWERFNE